MARDKAAALDRAIEAMASLLDHRSASTISVADISALSNCSTATLYQAFSSKEGLVNVAFNRSHNRFPTPEPQGPETQAALLRLATYLYRRAAYIGSGRSAALTRALLRHPAEEKHSLAEGILGRDPLPKVAELVDEAMRDGHVKPGNSRQIAYCLKAAASFKPAIWGLFLDRQIASTQLIGDVLTPFLTAEGKAALTEAAASIADDDKAASYLDQ